MKKAVTSSQSNPFTYPKSTRKRVEEDLAQTDVKRSMLLKGENEAVEEKDRTSGGKLFLNHNHNHHKKDHEKGVPSS